MSDNKRNDGGILGVVYQLGLAVGGAIFAAISLHKLEEAKTRKHAMEAALRENNNEDDEK